MKKKKTRKTKKGRKIIKSRHHIIPASRGGSSMLENIAVIDSKKHQYYHAIFDNQTPSEIINTLVNEYWNGKWKYVERAYIKYYG